MALLDEITYPKDLRRLERDDLPALVDEVQSLRARLNDMEDRLSTTAMHDDAGKPTLGNDTPMPPGTRKS